MSDPRLNGLRALLDPKWANEREEFAVSWRGKRRDRSFECATAEDLRQSFRRMDPWYYEYFGFDGLGIS